jgi:hypothetical protein
MSKSAKGLAAMVLVGPKEDDGKKRPKNKGLQAAYREAFKAARNDDEETFVKAMENARVISSASD